MYEIIPEIMVAHIVLTIQYPIQIWGSIALRRTVCNIDEKSIQNDIFLHRNLYIFLFKSNIFKIKREVYCNSVIIFVFVENSIVA